MKNYGSRERLLPMEDQYDYLYPHRIVRVSGERGSLEHQDKETSKVYRNGQR